MTPTAEYADFVLPSCTTFESNEFGMWPFPYLQLVEKVIEPLYESKHAFWMYKELAERMGLGQYFEGNEEDLVKEMLKSRHVEGVTLEALKKGPVKLYDAPDPFVLFADKKFITPSGRMEFYAEKFAEMGEALPLHKEPLENEREAPAEKYPLVFFNTHPRHRWNSTYQTSDWLREIVPEPELEIHPKDAQARGISDGDVVIVFNDRGRCKLKAKLTEGIRPGIVNIEQGWWAGKFMEGSHQELTHCVPNEAQDLLGLANVAFYDVLVEVKKFEPER
jgi:molybdopterin-containing oxidoreductase family molybdopterin binding subunit